MDVLSPRALCTIDDVKEFVGGFDPSKTETDDLLTREVNAVSDEIHRYGGREFQAIERLADGTVPLATRVFQVRQDGYRDDDTRELVLVVGDLAEKPTQVVWSLYDGSVQQTLATVNAVDGAVVCEPLRREPWQPIGELRFRSGLTGSLAPARSDTIALEARWGFPVLPEVLRKAAYTQAAIWFARDVRNYATVFSLETGRFMARPRPLDDAIRAMVDEFRVPRTG
jgi:hypothetical protein